MPKLRRPRIIVTGHKNHGKTETCNILKTEHFLRFNDTSKYVVDIIFPILKDKYGYASAEECYADKDNHRPEWYQIICAYNTPNKSRVVEEVFQSGDIHCGIRDSEELQAALDKGIVDMVIWVDALDRLPPEPESSMTINPQIYADYILDNNGDINQLKKNIADLMILIEQDYNLSKNFLI